MLTKFQFRELDNPRVYYSPDYRNFVLNHRSSFNGLAEALIAENDEPKAREILLYNLEKMPDRGVKYDYTTARTVELLFEVGENEKALEIAAIMSKRADEMAGYLASNRDLGREFQISMAILGELQRVMYKYGETELANKLDDLYRKHAGAVQTRTIDPSDF
jgi:hypothetical protein